MFSDTHDFETKNDEIIVRRVFRHKTFEERLDDYDNKITVCDFDWGEPMGKELLGIIFLKGTL